MTDTPAGRFEALADNALITPYRDSDAAREFASWCFNNRTLILSALRAAEGDGFVLVPREPTVDMVERGREQLSQGDAKVQTHARVMWVWEAMIDARPLPAPPVSEEGKG